MSDNFKLLMLSAMYENGGNTTHRLLDGHPELFVYPFESQPGTKYVNDYFTSMFPVKYRWPVFPGHIGADGIFSLIIDEEAKVRARTPRSSKFQSANFDFSDEERKKFFINYLSTRAHSRKNIMEAFFRSTFNAWKNYKTSGQEKMYVGYSPVIGIDGDKIIEEFQGSSFVLHIVRNPFSAYADTKKRAVPLSLSHYITGWVINQYSALLFQKKYPNNFFVARFEDVIKNPEEQLGQLMEKMKIKKSESLNYPSWNGEKLAEVYPWGTIRVPSESVNMATAAELSSEEITEISNRTALYIDALGYRDLLNTIQKKLA